MWVIVKYWINPFSVAHRTADGLPHIWAIRLIFWARSDPTSRIMRVTLLSKAFESFSTIAPNNFESKELRTVSTTLMVKSTLARSSLLKTRNHTPRRMARVFIPTNMLVVKGMRDHIIQSASTNRPSSRSCISLGYLRGCRGHHGPLWELSFAHPAARTP